MTTETIYPYHPADYYHFYPDPTFLDEEKFMKLLRSIIREELERAKMAQHEGATEYDPCV